MTTLCLLLIINGQLTCNAIAKYVDIQYVDCRRDAIMLTTKTGYIYKCEEKK
jgi:hypothetical protein